MKMKALCFALLVAVNVSAFAGNDEPGITIVSSKNSDVFKLIYKRGTSGIVRVYVYDANGNVVHSDRINGLDGFIYPMNFKGLTPGDYMIEVVDEKGRYQQAVSFNKSADLKSVHVSKILEEPGKFLLAVANVRNQPVFITIYDSANRVIHNESRTLEADFAQVYTLPDAYRKYTFEISDISGRKKHFTF